MVEADHHGRPSVRVAGRIIATVPDGDAVNMMVEDDVAHAPVAARPDCVSLLWWGKQRRAPAGLRRAESL